MCKCPSCNTSFLKTNYQQAFCKTRTGTKCKDKYWNNVIPSKRNNTVRISPASARFLSQKELYFDPFDIECSMHPLDSYSLGQE